MSSERGTWEILSDVDDDNWWWWQCFCNFDHFRLLPFPARRPKHLPPPWFRSTLRFPRQKNTTSKTLWLSSHRPPASETQPCIFDKAYPNLDPTDISSCCTPDAPSFQSEDGQQDEMGVKEGTCDDFDTGNRLSGASYPRNNPFWSPKPAYKTHIITPPSTTPCSPPNLR